MDWLQEAFGKFLDIHPALLVAVIVVVIAAIVGIVWLKNKEKNKEDIGKASWTTREITTAALSIGLAFLLSYIRIFRMPMGGSITPASMLPIMAFAYIYGVRKGLLTGLIYAVLQFIQDPVVLTPVQVILDYFLAFSLLGLAGLFEKSIIPGIIVGGAARFVCSFLSGWVFFGMYAPEGMPAWLYSLGYSGTQMGVEIAICVGVALIPAVSNMFTRVRRSVQQQAAAAS